MFVMARAGFIALALIASSPPARGTTLTGSPGAPDGASLPAFGSQFHATWTDYTDRQRTVVLDRLEQAGVEWVRIDVGWETLQPRRPGRFVSWYFDLLESAVDEANERGLSVLVTVFATPRWASGDGDAAMPPRDPSDYGSLVGRLARSFEGRVDAYEVWNEPNSEAFFKGTPADYVALLKAAHSAIKEADPRAEVVAGSTQYNDDAYLEAVYEAGGGDYFDVWSTHPYMGKSDAPPDEPDDGTPYMLDHVRTVQGVMTENGDGDLPIWFTEFGWSSHTTSAEAPAYRRGVTKTKQAEYLVRALRFVAEEHPYVPVMIWYTERNKNTGDRHEDNYGLLTRRLRPKPAYRAVRDLLSETRA
jgi:hypothetical protein